MKRYIFLTFLLLTFLVISNCSRYGKGIPINNIRIEGISINKVFIEDKPAEKARAFWTGSEVNVFYDTTNTKTRETATVELRFNEEEEGYFSTSKGILGKVISISTDKSLSEEDIVALSEDERKKLIFVIYQNDRNDPYYNMVLIKGGTFNMGSRKTLDEIPIHRVTVNDFYMDKHEVTVMEFIKFCSATRRKYPPQPFWNKDNHPAVNISWKDANAYAKWLGKRLPTEAEWEYAARSGNNGHWFAWGNVKPQKKRGDNIADEAVRVEYSSWNYWEGYYDGYVFTSPVGSFLPNLFGLYDMGGNTKEWCSDWYIKNYYKKSPKHNPKGPAKGSRRILRGGSWNYGPGDIRLTKRYRFKSTLKLNYIGFRCVKDVE